MSFLKANIDLRLSNFKLDINCRLDEEITGIFGPSGAGKTTFLKALAGLQDPDKGEIVVLDRLLFDSSKGLNLPPEKRKIGYVFQEGRLFPHLTVIQNLNYGVHDRKDITHFREITEMLKITEILSSKISQISGGQAQRVAIGRALLSKPDILILDEPFSSLDKKLRQHIISSLKPLITKFKLPVLVVSHELADLLMLSENLLIIKDGQCAGQGNYYDLIARNDSMNALSDAGLINSIELSIDYVDGERGLMHLSYGDIRISAEAWMNEERFLDENKVNVILRPEDVTLAAHRIEDISIQNQLEGRIDKLITKKNKVLCIVDHGFKLISEVSLATKQKMKLREGMRIWSLFKAAAIKLNSPAFVNNKDFHQI